MKHKSIFASLTTALLLLSSYFTFTSCDYKDLCYDHHHLVEIRVIFDWVYAPEAQPQSMTVLFYNLDDPGAEPTRFDLPGRDGGIVKVVPGNYRVVGFNGDTEAILLRNVNTWNMLEAYTRESSIEAETMLSRARMPRAFGTENERVILEPDMLWAAASEPFQIDLSENYVTYDDSIKGAGGIASRVLYTVTLQPRQRVRKVNIYVNNVQNLTYSSQFGGALSGLSPSVVLADGKLGEELVSHAYLLAQTSATQMEAHFNFFGHCPELSSGNENSHIVTIYAALGDGTKWYYTIDVTDQMHDPIQNPDEYNLNIYIDELPVPKPLVNGSGFVPTLDGWEEHVFEVGN